MDDASTGNNLNTGPLGFNEKARARNVTEQAIGALVFANYKARTEAGQSEVADTPVGAPGLTVGTESAILRALREGQKNADRVDDKPTAELIRNDGFIRMQGLVVDEETKQRWADLLTGTSTIMGILVMCYERRIIGIADGYWKFVPIQDRINGAVKGFLKAVDVYKPGGKVPFGNLAGRYAYQGVKHAVAEYTGVCIEYQDHVAVAARLVHIFEDLYGRAPTDEELARQLLRNANGDERTGGLGWLPFVPISDVPRAITLYHARESQDLLAVIRANQGGKGRFVDALRDFVSGSSGEENLVTNAMQQLTPAQLRVLHAFLGGKETDNDMANVYGELTARTLLEDALNQLQAQIASGAGINETIGESVNKPLSISERQTQEVRQLTEKEFGARLGDASDPVLKVRMCMQRRLTIPQTAERLGFTTQEIARSQAKIKADSPAFTESYLRSIHAASKAEQAYRLLATGQYTIEQIRRIARYNENEVARVMRTRLRADESSEAKRGTLEDRLSDTEETIQVRNVLLRQNALPRYQRGAQ